MVCLECKRDIVPIARGVCQSCYLKLKKKGKLPPKKIRVRSECVVPGCSGYVVSGGLCGTHYKRLKRQGHLHETRPYLNGKDNRSSMSYESWRNVRKSKVEYPVEWNDFRIFISQVGERPTLFHKLFLLDDSKPHSKDNSRWLTDCEMSNIRKNRKNEKELELRKSGIITKKMIYNNRKKYGGLSAKEYNELFVRSNGVCMICKKPEKIVRKGKPIRLSVDHCHNTGKVRGLLCHSCNSFIGLAKDDVTILESAIRYLGGKRP